MSGEPQSSSLWTTIGVGAAVVGLTVATPLATVAAPVVLAALIIEGSSTNSTGEGIRDFFQGKFNQPDPALREVNFLTGPFGIWRALAASPDEHNTVMSSGWGAANESLLISYLRANPTPANTDMLENTTWVLDNNVAGPNGGFGTRYPVFAAIGVNPIPTPGVGSDTTVISTAYQYDINGNAPKYILNPVADLNSLAAYFNRRLTQADLPMPVDADGTVRAPDGSPIPCDNGCDITDDYEDANGKYVTVHITKVNGVTYVGYETDGLPLVQPLRDYLGDPGDQIADVLEPGLTALVNYGYPDNDPLANPGSLERAALLPTLDETERFLHEFVNGVRTGIETLRPGDDEEGSETVAPQRLSVNPKLPDLPTPAEFAASISAPVKRALHPPKPTPISAKAAVDRLTKAFTPKKPSSLNRVTQRSHRSEKAADATP